MTTTINYYYKKKKIIIIIIVIIYIIFTIVDLFKRVSGAQECLSIRTVIS